VRIAVTADLHFEHSHQSRLAAAAVARAMCQAEPDALVLAGDTFAHGFDTLDACLEMFAPFRGPKCLVAGNHDLWVRNGTSSRELYESLLPERVREHGFHYLDQGPLVLGHVGIVGNVGWYDYSLRDPDLGLPLRFYECKIGPRLAAAVAPARHLLDTTDDISPAARDLACFWSDGRYVRWGCSDSEFTLAACERLHEHLGQVAPRVETILCVTHHLAFENMVHRHERAALAFTNGFLGSRAFGEVMLRHPKVGTAVCGHSHRPGRAQNGPVRCLNVGSTYTTKQFEMIAL